jgi:hypothetical protein
MIKSLIILIASFVRSYIMMLVSEHVFFPEINPHNETLHIKSNLCFVYWVLLCFSFVFLFLKICIIIQWYVHSVFWKKLTFSAFDPWDCKICKTIFAESDAKLLECQRCKEIFCIKCLKNQIQSKIYYQSQTQLGLPYRPLLFLLVFVHRASLYTTAYN